MNKPGPGRTWRTLVKTDLLNFETSSYANPGLFDELVIDNWLHLEYMSGTTWWLRVGDAAIMVTVDENGRASRVDITRGEYD